MSPEVPEYEDDMIFVTPLTYKSVLENIFGYKPTKYIKEPIPVDVYQLDCHFEVQTPEGAVEGQPGDYLIVNPNGSMYPAAKKEFEDMYIPFTEFNYSSEAEPI